MYDQLLESYILELIVSLKTLLVIVLFLENYRNIVWADPIRVFPVYVLKLE